MHTRNEEGESSPTIMDLGSDFSGVSSSSNVVPLQELCKDISDSRGKLSQ